ncbi:hypothetical protein GS432_06175 [Rhodococcus hoagii]|nr:hypothetical protein [Prescottella equi]
MVVHPAAGSESFGIRFRPGAAPHVLRTSAAQIRDIRVSLADVLGAAAERVLVDRLEHAHDTSERLTILQDTGRSWLAARHEPDPLAARITSALAVRSWTVESLADASSMTSRQLHRRLQRGVRVRAVDVAVDPAPAALHGVGTRRPPPRPRVPRRRSRFQRPGHLSRSAGESHH